MVVAAAEAAVWDPIAGEEAEEPDMSMEAAADVVDAIAVAEIGRGWLWVPS